MDRQLIEHYANGGEKLKQSIRGLTAEDLSAVPDPAWDAGKWTIADVVIHLQDAETAFADRIRRFVAEDEPTVQEWSENKFVERLHYPKQSAEDAVELIALTRRQLARVLRHLPDSAFDRAGTHTRAGRMTVSDVLAKADWHLDHHLKFINAKREKLGKLMW